VFTLTGSELTDQQIKQQFTLASQIWQIKFVILNITPLEGFTVPTDDASLRRNQSQEVQQLFHARKRAYPNTNNVAVFYSDAHFLA
jgi:hypothetical protein